MLGTLAEGFYASLRKISIYFAKVGYYESLSLCTVQLVKGYHSRHPGFRQENGTVHLPFPSYGSSQASENEASPQPNTMVLKRILAPAAGTA